MGLTKPKIVKSTLPELSNPATEENIEYGFEAIDSAGNVITGEREIPSAVWGHVTVSATADAAFNIPLPFSGDVTSIVGGAYLLSGTYAVHLYVANEANARYWVNSDKKMSSVTMTRPSNTAVRVPARSTNFSGSTKAQYHFAVCQDPDGTKII